MEKVIDIYGGEKWEKIEGNFLLGASSEFPINTIGGEKTHTLTLAEIPIHEHSVPAHAHGLNNHTHSFTWQGSHSHTPADSNYFVSKPDTEVADACSALSGSGQYVPRSLESGWGYKSTTASTTLLISGNTSAPTNVTNTANSGTFNTGSNGSSGTHNNMPPYKTVYIWERVE